MSAFIVEEPHIHVLVQAFINERLIDPAEATATGAMLWGENHKGVNTRYQETTPTPPYRFEGIEAPLEDAVVLMAAHCFNYQCAEFDGYDKQPGVRLVHDLIETIWARLGITKATERAFTERHSRLVGRHLWSIGNIAEAIRADAMGWQPVPGHGR